MEGLVIFIGLGVAFALLAGLIAFFRDINLGNRMAALERRCAQLSQELRELQAQRRAPAPPAATQQQANPPPAAAVLPATTPMPPAPTTAPMEGVGSTSPAAPPTASDHQPAPAPNPPGLAIELPHHSLDIAAAIAVADLHPMTTAAAPPADGAAESASPTPPSPGAAHPERLAALHAIADRRPRTAEKQATAAAWARFEDVVGRRWMSWLGAFLVFIAGSFAVRYCMVHSYIGPLGRLIGGSVVAASIVVTGDILVRRGWRAFGQGVLGLGLRLGYAVLFAAFAYPEVRVLSQSAAFLAMVVLTALGVWRSIRHDAVPIATLATIGGLLTPVLLANGSGSRDVLLAYLLLLDAGVLAVALWRRWPVLNSVAFIGTEVMIGVWWDRQGEAAGTLAMAVWAMAFWLVFGAVAVAYRLRWRAMMAAEGYLLGAANAIVTLIALHCALYGTSEIEALFAAAIACGYGLLALHAERLFGGDQLARGGFSGLAAMSVTAIVPMLLGGSPLTAAWAAEAILLAWLCRRHAFAPLGFFALIVLAIAMTSGLHAIGTSTPDLPVFNAGCACDSLVLVAAVAVALLLRRAQAHAEQVRVAGWVAMSGPAWLAVRLGGECLSWGSSHSVLVPAWAQASLCVADCAALPALARSWPWAEERLRGACVLLALAAFAAVLPVIHSLAAGMSVTSMWDPRYLALGAVAVVAVVIARLRWPTEARAIIHGLAWWCGASWHAAVALAHLQSPVGSTAALAACGWAVVGAAAAVTARAHGGTPAQPLVMAAGAMLCVLVGHAQHDWSGTSLFNALTGAGIVVTAALATIAAQSRDPLRGWTLAGAAAWLMAVLHLDLVGSVAAARASDFAHPQQLAAAAWLMAGALSAFFLGSRSWWHSFSCCCAAVVIIISLVGYLGPLPVPRACAHPSFIYGTGALLLLAYLTRLSAVRASDGWQKLLAATLLWGWLLITLEAFSAVMAMGLNPSVRLVSVTIAWSLYAMALLALGFRLRVRALRIIALGLFALTVAKLALFDLAYLHDLARILSFLVAGALLMAGSWAYQRLERRFG